MEKYRNGCTSPLNSTYPFAKSKRFLNTGPLYTMGTSTNFHHNGPQLLMNTANVGTSTQFQFVPARHLHQSSNNSTGPFQFDVSNSIAPIFNSVRTFFNNLLRPKLEAMADTLNSVDTSTEKRKCNSAPNIYMGIMSDGKCAGDFDKNCFDYETLAKLSSCTKSFSDYNLPVSAVKSSNCSPTPITQKCTEKTDVSRSFDEVKLPAETKETNFDKPLDLPSPVPVPPMQPTQTKRCIRMPNVPIKPRPRNSGVSGKRSGNKKSKRKSGKNKKEKVRHELALKIHEDCDTEIETLSTDEWDEPIVIVTASPTKKSPTIDQPNCNNNNSPAASFSTDDFPAMPLSKQTWELPKLSQCLAAFKGKRQRQISECDSEDSFIVFDSENEKFTPSSVESNQSICDRIRNRLSMGGRQRQISESSDDDFICFEMEQSDAESDCDDVDENVDCDEETLTSDSECESEVDGKSSGTNPPDSGFEDKKVSLYSNVF